MREVFMDQWNNLEGRLQDTYQNHLAREESSRVTYVDDVGWQVWRDRYLQLARMNVNHESSMRTIENEIAAIEGNDVRWPDEPGHPGGPLPPGQPGEPQPGHPGPSPSGEGITGNYLAQPGYENAHMYPGWSPQKRENFRQEYEWGWLPFASYGAYGGVSFDFHKNIDGLRNLIGELNNAEISTMLFLITDGVNGFDLTPDNYKPYVKELVTNTRDIVGAYCHGWELNQVKDWSLAGETEVELSHIVKGLAPNIPLYAHWQDRWWGPHYPPGDERTFWRDAATDGLAYQDTQGDDDKLFYLMMDCDAGTQPHGGGIYGRMVEELGRKFIFFESVEAPYDHNVWKRRVDRYVREAQQRGGPTQFC